MVESFNGIFYLILYIINIALAGYYSFTFLFNKEKKNLQNITQIQVLHLQQILEFFGLLLFSLLVFIFYLLDPKALGLSL